MSAMRFAHAHNKKLQTKSLLRAGIRFVFSCVGLTDSFDESTSFCTSVMLYRENQRSMGCEIRVPTFPLTVIHGVYSCGGFRAWVSL